MRLLPRSAASIVNLNGISSAIDDQLLPGFVLLAQHPILFAAPALVQLAETGVAIAVRMSLPVFFPQQLRGHMRMALPLPVKPGEVWHRQHSRARPGWTA